MLALSRQTVNQILRQFEREGGRTALRRDRDRRRRPVVGPCAVRGHVRLQRACTSIDIDRLHQRKVAHSSAALQPLRVCADNDAGPPPRRVAFFPLAWPIPLHERPRRSRLRLRWHHHHVR
ncbi:hypothetical protein [Paraburkholderia lycopersici]|uniref:hypothetical protein n=1 Tax=Paraburkholderia lycopersici TaxID=416944 RepID=UPI003CCC3803